MSAPNRGTDVAALAAQHSRLLVVNTWESCGQFIRLAVADLNIRYPDDEWVLVGKTAGEGQAPLPRGLTLSMMGTDGRLVVVTGHSHDVIWHQPSNTQIDILTNAAANSDSNQAIHGPAGIGWHPIPQESYRPNNPMLPLELLAPVVPPPIEPPEPPLEPCVVTVGGPTDLTLGPGVGQILLEVQTSRDDCPWVALTSEAWLQVDLSAFARTAMVTVHVSTNLSPDDRTGEVAIHAAGVRVHQCLVYQRGTVPVPPAEPWWRWLLRRWLGR
jgi:hypothetical protein